MQNSLGIVKKPILGGDVDTYCGRCKETREHAIAALSPQGGIERVQCRTCHNNHLYREKQDKPTRSRATSERRTTSTASEPVGPTRRYSMQEHFRTGDRIEHPKFGLGVVMEERSGKIDVKFGREMKTLINGS
jgi:hypothetical protein